MLKGYKLTNCQFCGSLVERLASHIGCRPATCFDCKRDRRQLRDIKNKPKRVARRRIAQLNKTNKTFRQGEKHQSLDSWPWMHKQS